MKKINKKIMLMNIILCIIPILFALHYYEKIPTQVPIHFSIDGTPNNYLDKYYAFIVFPIILLVVELVVCVIVDVKNKSNRFTAILKELIPFVSVGINIPLIFYSLGEGIDIRKISIIIVSIIFILLGNYMPKHSYIDNNFVSLPTKIKKSKYYYRYMGVLGSIFFLFGILMILSTLLSAVLSIIIVVLLMISLVLTTIYFYNK